MSAVPSVKLTVYHRANDSKLSSEVFKGNPTVINSDMSSDTAVLLDTWAKGFTNLSTDTYEDTTINISYSLNEIIAEEG